MMVKGAKMNDPISRQAAIDALKVAYWNNDIQSAKDDPCIVDAMTDWAIRQIKALPSSQQEIIRCEDCKHWGMHKSLNVPRKMNDLISKQAAINTTFNMCCRWDGEDRDDLRNMMLTAFQELPTIDPVKHGKWIPFEFGDETWHKCTACGAADQYGTKHISHITGKAHIVYSIRNYCPKCGARMNDPLEEPEITPCRGCEDYDWHGNCKSHGGCGAERSEDEPNN